MFILPLLYRFQTATTWSAPALCTMGVALGFYYVSWARYVLRGREPVLLYKPQGGVPVPLAISPVIYFLAASVALGSVPLAVAAVMFGGAHVSLALVEHKRLTSVANRA